MLNTQIKEADWKSFEETEFEADVPYWFKQENGNVVLAFWANTGGCSGWAKAYFDDNYQLKYKPNEFYILRNAKVQPAISTILGGCH